MNDFAVGNMWDSVIEKYSDQAHFIYELLQNVDDSEAKECLDEITEISDDPRFEKIAELVSGYEFEEALDLLKVREHLLDDTKKQELDEYKLWHLMKYDFNMCAIGRTTFLSFIDKIPTEPQENNNCIDLVEWYYDNQPITKLRLYEILKAIKAIWIAGNYFWKIQIKNLDENEKDPLFAKKFELSFFHHCLIIAIKASSSIASL